MSRFWLRVLELKPEFAGSIVYFCPSKASLRCIINDDGTVSPVCALATRFNSAVRFADVLKSGRLKLPPDFRIAPRVSSTFYSFSQDFFLEPGRISRVKDYFPPATAKELFAIENAQERMQQLVPVDGINLDEPIVMSVTETPTDASQSAAEATAVDATIAGVLDTTDSTHQVEAEAESETDGFDLSDFWTVAIHVKPDLVGKTVYFAPTKTKHVACVINNDATFSPLCDQSKRYTEAVDLAMDIVGGKLHLGGDGFMALNKSPILYTCVTDFFLDTDRYYSVLASLGKFGRCAGIEREKFEPVIQDRRWDAERREFSPVIFEGKTVRSKNCLNVAVGEKRRCFACDKSVHVLRRLLRRQHGRPAKSYEQRIRFMGDRWLTADERKEKNEMIQREQRKAVDQLRRQVARMSKLEEELKKYKPVHEVNRAAVRSLVEHLNEETSKSTSPKCCWMEEEGGEVCGFTTDSVANMCAHVNSVHHRSQVTANSDVDEETRKFYCFWQGCSRNRRPFPTAHQLHLHLFEHTGSRISVQRLSVMRCQLINLSRSATARRYNDAMKESILSGDYQSRGTWDTARSASFLPLPCHRVVRNIRGGLKKKAEKRRAREANPAVLNDVFDSVLQRVLGNSAGNGGDGEEGGSQNGGGMIGEGAGGGGPSGQANHVDAAGMTGKNGHDVGDNGPINEEDDDENDGMIGEDGDEEEAI